MELKTIATCRKGFKISIPCNWNVKGDCGADTFPCILTSFEGKSPVESLDTFKTVPRD